MQNQFFMHFGVIKQSTMISSVLYLQLQLTQLSVFWMLQRYVSRIYAMWKTPTFPKFQNYFKFCHCVCHAIDGVQCRKQLHASTQLQLQPFLHTATLISVLTFYISSYHGHSKDIIDFLALVMNTLIFMWSCHCYCYRITQSDFYHIRSDGLYCNFISILLSVMEVVDINFSVSLLKISKFWHNYWQT